MNERKKREPIDMIMRTSIDHLHRCCQKFQEAIKLLFGCSFFFISSLGFFLFYLFHSMVRHTYTFTHDIINVCRKKDN